MDANGNLPSFTTNPSGLHITAMQSSSSGQSSSSTQLFAKYTIDSGTPATLGLITLNVGQNSSNDINFQINYPATPTPSIQFNGQDVTSTTQMAVVGQQISLSASFNLPSGLSIQSQSWSVPGTTIGDFSGSYDSGQTTPSDFTQQNSTFYWLDAAQSRSLTYTVTFSNGATSSANVTFNVEGPTNVHVATQLGTVSVTNSALGLGGSLSNIGIDLTASSTQPTDFSGSYSWVQIVKGSTAVFTANDRTKQTCTYGPGYDGVGYPYELGREVDDNPNISLDTSDLEVTVSDSFRMYLLWTPTISQSSIAVPLGYVDWSWSGDAVKNATTNQWSMASGDRRSNNFLASPSIENWNTWVYPATRQGVSCR